jgi:polyadenylate-binding protein
LELLKENIRYKNSKKRCNLYVKNFPIETTEDLLREAFEKYGEISSLKMYSPEESNSTGHFAFVCFSKPEDAMMARTELCGSIFLG